MDYDTGNWMDLAQERPMAGLWKSGNEPLGSLKANQIGSENYPARFN